MEEQTTRSKIRRAMEQGASPTSTGAKPQRAEFGLGACDCQLPEEIPYDYKWSILLCMYDHLPQSVLIPGHQYGQVLFTIFGALYACPVAWRVNVRDAVDCNLAREALVVAATIGRCSLFYFAPPSIVIGSVIPDDQHPIQYIKGSDLDPDDCCGCPTADWPCFTNVALGCPLVITLFNCNPPGITVRVSVDLAIIPIGDCYSWRRIPQNMMGNGLILPSGPVL